MSTLEYHVLLAMATGPIHGYAIKQAVETESLGTLVPRAGSLYRVIARLIARGLVREASGKNAPPHPGLARRYYALTAAGRSALASEAERLKSAAALAAKRLGAV
jgi:DNA-binding PadR family transcriptional regulator